jgi:hypothetical protein
MTTRCSAHGFIPGLCPEPTCQNWEGPSKGKHPRVVRSCAGGCGWATNRTYCTACRAAGVPTQRRNAARREVANG